MRRLFWLAMGITIGALVVRKLTTAAARLTPGGLSQSLGQSLAGLADSLRGFVEDVRIAMREREAELREGAGFDGEFGTPSSGPPPSGGPS